MHELRSMQCSAWCPGSRRLCHVRSCQGSLACCCCRMHRDQRRHVHLHQPAVCVHGQPADEFEPLSTSTRTAGATTLHHRAVATTLAPGHGSMSREVDVRCYIWLGIKVDRESCNMLRHAVKHGPILRSSGPQLLSFASKRPSIATRSSTGSSGSPDLANLQALISQAPSLLTNPALLASLSIPVVLGTITGATGALTGGYGWYKSLKKPWFTPPDFVFGIAWTALYLLMGLTAYRVYERTGFPSWALLVYLGQLGLNLLWFVLFFDAKQPALAQLENVVFFLLVCYTTYLFFQEDETAGLLMLPYVAWVAFANLINIGVVKRNQ